jgi:hypothetical protein
MFPATQLTALGAGWEDNTEWTLLCGRYNYASTDLKTQELPWFRNSPQPITI